MCRDEGLVSVSEGSLRAAFVWPKRLASTRWSFSLMVMSMICPRSPSGTEERMRACRRSSFSRSSALAVKRTW
jgi:hypothetical protein